MKYFKHIIQIAIAGLLVALGYIVGYFGYFTIGTGRIYLLIAIAFLYPLFLSPYFLIITMTSTVVLVDFSTGWIGFTWISIIAYNVALIIIWFFYKFLRWKIIYMLSTIIASALLILIYFFIEIPILGYSFAISDLIATSIEVAICLPICWILFFPIKLIPKPYI